MSATDALGAETLTHLTEAIQSNGQSDTEAKLTARGMNVVLSVRSTAHVLEMPPPDYIIDDWIVAGSLFCVFGRPGAFKSLVVQSMVFCLASGQPWYGHTVLPCRVLYLAAEGAGGLGKRINVWCEDTGTPEGDLEELRWLPIALNLLDDELAAGLVAAALDCKAEVVIIDTLARTTPGANENDSIPFSKVVAVADRLRSHGIAVGVVHHSPKSGEGMRGHTVLEGAIDTAIEAKREPGQPSVTLTMTKQKDFIEAEPLYLKERTVGDSVVLDRSKFDGTLSPKARDLLDVIRNSDGTGLTAAELQDLTGMAKTTYHNCVKDLAKRRLIHDLTPHGPASWAPTQEESVP